MLTPSPAEGFLLSLPAARGLNLVIILNFKIFLWIFTNLDELFLWIFSFFAELFVWIISFSYICNQNVTVVKFTAVKFYEEVL